MSSSFRSDLVTFADFGGNEYVSLALPPFSATQLKKYVVTGPVIPLGWPAPFRVESIENWIRKQQGRGFVFTRVA